MSGQITGIGPVWIMLDVKLNEEIVDGVEIIELYSNTIVEFTFFH
jgi:hypothetical protein